MTATTIYASLLAAGVTTAVAVPPSSDAWWIASVGILVGFVGMLVQSHIAARKARGLLEEIA